MTRVFNYRHTARDRVVTASLTHNAALKCELNDNRVLLSGEFVCESVYVVNGCMCFVAPCSVLNNVANIKMAGS